MALSVNTIASRTTERGGFLNCRSFALPLLALLAVGLFIVATAGTYSLATTMSVSQPGASRQSVRSAVTRWTSRWRFEAPTPCPNVPLAAVQATPSPCHSCPAQPAPAVAPASCSTCDDMSAARATLHEALPAIASEVEGGSRAAAYVNNYVDKKRAVQRAVRRLRSMVVELRDAVANSDIAGAVDNLLTTRMSLPDAPHEDDAILPEPSTQNCHMMSDGFDICAAENVCLDLPGPFSIERWDKPGSVLFVGSKIIGRGGAPLRRGSGAGGSGAASVGAAAQAERHRRRDLPLGQQDLDAEGVAARAERHRRRDFPRGLDSAWNVSGAIPRIEVKDAYDVVSGGGSWVVCSLGLAIAKVAISRNGSRSRDDEMAIHCNTYVVCRSTLTSLILLSGRCRVLCRGPFGLTRSPLCPKTR